MKALQLIRNPILKRHHGAVVRRATIGRRFRRGDVRTLHHAALARTLGKSSSLRPIYRNHLAVLGGSRPFSAAGPGQPPPQQPWVNPEVYNIFLELNTPKS